MKQLYLSLGSNLGDREANLRAGNAALPAVGVRVRKVSSFYETEPVDYVHQPWFLNCAVQGQTDRDPLALLRQLQGIELQLGSQKEFKKGPRLLDIDILLYGDETVETPELQVPHPRMLERRFVLVPLAEIAPTVSHPAWQGMTVRQALERTTDRSEVRQIQADTKPK